MNREHWTQVKQLFYEVLLVEPARRDEWLGAHCADETIGREVRSLLASYEAERGFLEETRGAGRALFEALEPAAPGRRVGSYRLVREIGRGGMGVVYEAAREGDFSQRVAIKLVQPGWHNQSLVERFRYERRILARLDHANIARLLDGGATEDGAPYFVMEFVDGVLIHDYCQARQLDIRARVDLFERVCEAVAHAHANLVLHCDLKPGNILVTPDGQPKLLDFGIAKLIADEAELPPESARTGGLFLTPEYASPESASGRPATIAGDVYALGAVLYLLLTGRMPLDLAGLTTLEALRLVCERDPEPPSAVAGEASRRALAGDLDNIVMKCLRKEPAERFPSAGALAGDLRAWKEGRPVSASAQTFRYRAGKFLRRYRLQAAAAGLVLLSLLAGGAATAWQAHVARRERDRAQNRFRQVREFSRSLLFEVHESLRKLPGATEPRRLLLARAVGFLDGLAKDVQDDSALALELAEGYRRLGHVQGSDFSDNLGDRQAAIQSYEKAAALGEDVVRRQPRTLDAWMILAGAYDDLTLARFGQGETARADAAYDRHRAVAEILERDFHGDPRARTSLATSFSNLAFYRAQKGDTAGAKDFYRRAIREFEQLAAQDRLPARISASYAFALKRLGAILIVEGRLDEADTHYRRALALEETAAARQPGDSELRYDMTFSMTDLALIARKRGDYAAAGSLYRRALDVRRQALAADPINRRILIGVANVQVRLGNVLREEQKLSEAAALLRQGLELSRQILRLETPSPDHHVRLANAQLCLAQTLLDQAETTPGAARPRLDEARSLLQASRTILAVKANAEADRGQSLPIVLRELERAGRLAK